MNLHINLQIEETALITKLLVAIDGSANSDKALDFGLDIAEKYSASVHILNVFQLPAIYGYPDEPFGYQANMTSFIKDLRKIHETILSKASARAIKAKPDLEITIDLQEGDPASQIVETAKQNNVDAIVLGHRGWNRIQEFFLGGTSERVAHLAQCTVFIVK